MPKCSVRQWVETMFDPTHRRLQTMINEWILHLFQHLRALPSFHMAQMMHVDSAVARRHDCTIEKSPRMVIATPAPIEEWLW